jgi:NAD(P)-dependent dehydrogenase (short-subunit alcohol dehydrogenase family)
LDVDVVGAFLCARAFAPALVESGRGVIVNVSSIYGMVGPDQRLYDDGGGRPAVKPPGYSVSKAALAGFTRYLAAYYRDRLRVVTLTLGGVWNEHDAGFAERYGARTPLGRMARADEYTGTLLYLISDAASYVTGANIVVDGGWTAW